MALNVDVADVELLVAGLSEAGIDAFEMTGLPAHLGQGALAAIPHPLPGYSPD